MINIILNLGVKIDYSNNEYSEDEIKEMVIDFLDVMYNHVKYIWNVEVKKAI